MPRFVTIANWLSYVFADVFNIAVGSWAAFRGNAKWGTANVSLEFAGLSLGLVFCIREGQSIGVKQFHLRNLFHCSPHAADGPELRYHKHSRRVWCQ